MSAASSTAARSSEPLVHWPGSGVGATPSDAAVRPTAPPRVASESRVKYREVQVVSMGLKRAPCGGPGSAIAFGTPYAANAVNAPRETTSGLR